MGLYGPQILKSILLCDKVSRHGLQSCFLNYLNSCLEFKNHHGWTGG